MKESTQQAHWETVYTQKSPTALSWYQAEAQPSLSIIQGSGLLPENHVVDIGAGASPLLAALWQLGHRHLTAVDISQPALDTLQRQLPPTALVNFLQADIAELGSLNSLDKVMFWHDRAVLHFLTAASQRAVYFQHLQQALVLGGWALLAGHAPDGPPTCSGLPLHRPTPEELMQELGPAFVLHTHLRHVHNTPTGTERAFNYLLARRQEA